MPPQQPRSVLGSRYLPPPHPSLAGLGGQSIHPNMQHYALPYGYQVPGSYAVYGGGASSRAGPHWGPPVPQQHRWENGRLVLPSCQTLFQIAERSPWSDVARIQPNGERFVPPVEVWQPHNKMKVPLDGVSVSAQYSTMALVSDGMRHLPVSVKPFVGKRVDKTGKYGAQGNARG